MEFFTISMLNGLSYGLLLFMLSSGLTLIFSMMGVLNFAHASFYMIGAYIAYSISKVTGFWPALVIAPIVVGAILGNLDEDLKQFFGTHEPIIVPFMAFTLGQTINLKSVVTAGLPGVALGVTVLVVTGAVCIVVDRLLGGSGIAGAAASSTAGNSAAVPQAVALADTSFAPVAAAATVQVTASVIVTAILTPLLTAWWFRKVERSRALEAADQRVEEVTAQRY